MKYEIELKISYLLILNHTVMLYGKNIILVHYSTIYIYAYRLANNEFHQVRIINVMCRVMMKKKSSSNIFATKTPSLVELHGHFNQSVPYSLPNFRTCNDFHT